MSAASSIQDVDQLQLEAYRRMTGEERLRIGLGLYEASLGIAREAIRNRFPDTDQASIEETFRERIRVGFEIEARQNCRSPQVPLPKQVWGEGSERLERDSIGAGSLFLRRLQISAETPPTRLR